MHINLLSALLLVPFRSICQRFGMCYLVPTQWLFSQFVQNGPYDEREVIFQFFRC